MENVPGVPCRDPKALNKYWHNPIGQIKAEAARPSPGWRSSPRAELGKGQGSAFSTDPAAKILPGSGIFSWGAPLEYSCCPARRCWRESTALGVPGSWGEPGRGVGGAVGSLGPGPAGDAGIGKGTIPSIPSRAAGPAPPGLSHAVGRSRLPNQFLHLPLSFLQPGRCRSRGMLPSIPSPLLPPRCSQLPKHRKEPLRDAPGSLSVTPAALSGMVWVSWCTFGRLSPAVPSQLPSLARIQCRQGGGTRMAAEGEWVWELFQWAGGNRAGSTSSSQTRVTSSVTAGPGFGARV